MSERTKKILLIAVVGFLALSIVRGITGRFANNVIETEIFTTEQSGIDADDITSFDGEYDHDRHRDGHRHGRHHRGGFLFMLFGLIRAVLMGLGVLFLFKLIRRGRHRRRHGDHDGDGPPPGFRRGGRHRGRRGPRWSNEDEDIEINIDPDGEAGDVDVDADADALKKKLKDDE